MPAEFLDARQRDERRYKKFAVFAFIMFLSVVATYTLQSLGYVDLTLHK
jgi:hypothetical protein